MCVCALHRRRWWAPTRYLGVCVCVLAWWRCSVGEHRTMSYGVLSSVNNATWQTGKWANLSPLVETFSYRLAHMHETMASAVVASHSRHTLKTHNTNTYIHTHICHHYSWCLANTKMYGHIYLIHFQYRLTMSAGCAAFTMISQWKMLCTASWSKNCK